MTTAGAVTAVGPSAVGCAAAASPHHAALLIEHGDGAVLEYCIGFSADQVTGQYLLDASGVEKAEQTDGSMGEAVCQLDNEPEQYPSGCWTASSPYWAMYVSRGGAAWTQSAQGVSSQTFRDGDAEGFRYESQSAFLVPPSPGGVCPPPSSPSPASSSPPATSRPTATPAGVRPTPAPSPAAGNLSPPATTSAAAGPTPSATPSPAAGSGSDVTIVQGPGATGPRSPGGPGVALLVAGAMALALVILAVLRGARQRRVDAGGTAT